MASSCSIVGKTSTVGVIAPGPYRVHKPVGSSRLPFFICEVIFPLNGIYDKPPRVLVFFETTSLQSPSNQSALLIMPNMFVGVPRITFFKWLWRLFVDILCPGPLLTPVIRHPFPFYRCCEGLCYRWLQWLLSPDWGLLLFEPQAPPTR